MPPAAGALTLSITVKSTRDTGEHPPLLPQIARKAYDISISFDRKRSPKLGPLSTQFSCCRRVMRVMLLVCRRS